MPSRRARRSGRGWDADQAVTELYATHYRALTQLAALLVNDAAAAEDIVQAAYAAMHGAWRHRNDPDLALCYLRRAVVTRARRAARPDPPGRPPRPPGPGRPAAADPRALLLAALHALPARQREALVLRYYAGLPDAQIALAMGVSTRAVTTHIRRAMPYLQAFRGTPPAGQPRMR